MKVSQSCETWKSFAWGLLENWMVLFSLSNSKLCWMVFKRQCFEQSAMGEVCCSRAGMERLEVWEMVWIDWPSLGTPALMLSHTAYLQQELNYSFYSFSKKTANIFIHFSCNRSSTIFVMKWMNLVLLLFIVIFSILPHYPGIIQSIYDMIPWEGILIFFTFYLKIHSVLFRKKWKAFPIGSQYNHWASGVWVALWGAHHMHSSVVLCS